MKNPFLEDKESPALSPKRKKKYQKWIIHRKLTNVTVPSPEGSVLFLIPVQI
jgi:hypothetical protein